MIKNYLKTAWRNLQKNKLYSAINILGLSVGLTASLLIGVYIRHELSYDKFNVNAPRIVRLTMEYSDAGTVNKTAMTGTKPGPEFKRRFPSVQEYARTFVRHGIVKSGEKIFDEPRVLYADPAFFNIFSFGLVRGEASHVLDAPEKIVMSQSMAKKYFGSEDPVNKTLQLGNLELTVSGVCADIPQNSQIKFDFATQFTNMGDFVKQEQWWTANWITYLMLHNPADIIPLQSSIDACMKTPAVRTDAGLQGKDYLSYHLEPLARVHLYSTLEGAEPNGSITYIYVFAVIAVMILVIACANYTNLATAQSFGRSGEIGMRKVMGASRKQVFLQFIGETSFITALAAGIALVLATLLMPWFDYITGKAFSPSVVLQPLPVLGLAVFSVIISFFAGLYPALVLSGMQIMNVLKKGFRFTGGNNLLRKGLIVLQFGISVFLIIYTVIVLEQMQFMQNKDLGYTKDHIVELPIGGNMLDKFQSLKDALDQVRGVQSVTAAYDSPEFIQWGDGLTADDEKGKHQVSLHALPVDLDFIKTMKMQLLAGRDFQATDFAQQDTNNKASRYHQTYLINETLAKTLGWTPAGAINRIVSRHGEGPVVGVVKDFNFTSLHEPIGPLLIFLQRDFSRRFMVRIEGNDVPGTLSRLQTLWKQRIPDRPFNFSFLDENYNKLYLSEQRSSALFGVAAGTAIVLACLGLFGLAAFTTVQRTKEIGIRRVLGANSSTIILLIARNFLQLVTLAMLISMPFAWWAGHQWLEDFAFRIPVQSLVFIGTAGVTALVVLCTVGYHALRVARANPVKSLRMD